MNGQIAHVIREIQHLQKGVYKIELNTRVADYLLDASRHLQDDEMYRCSLAIEPRQTNSSAAASSSGQSNQRQNGGSIQLSQTPLPACVSSGPNGSISPAPSTAATQSQATSRDNKDQQQRRQQQATY